jgi:hypothetical protein
MKHLALALLLAAPATVGCGQTFLEPNVDSGPEGLYVSDIEPHYGPTAGGNTVTITGGGFEGEVSVGFGNAVVGATVLDEGTITVSAPSSDGMELTVDVVIGSEQDELTVPGGYTFTDSDIPPDPDDTAGGEIEGVGGVVEFSHLQIACTDCFGATSPQVYAFAAFHDATSQTWTDWLPSPGSCAQDPGSVQPTTSFLDVGQNVHLVAGSNSITLTRTTVSGDVQYDGGALSDADFQRNTAFDLEAADGGSWGPFTVVDAVTTGQMITSISPVELLYVQIQQAFQPGLLSQPIQYSPYGGSGSFVVLLGFYSADGSQYLGSVVCRDYDNGTFTLHQGYANAYPRGSLVAVYMYRYLIEWTPNPAAGSYLESVTSIGVVGTTSIR